MKRTLCIALLLTVGFAAGAGATSFVNVRDEALVDGAPLAVVGRVLAVDRAAGLADGRTRTEIRIAVEDVLKGYSPGGDIVVEVPGGLAANGMTLKIYGAPRVRQDERLLLFLAPRGTSFTIEHLMLGVFHETRLADRSLAVRSFEGATEMRLGASGLEAAAGSEPLRDFTRFAEWVRARAIGAEGSAYRIAEENGLRLAVDSFGLFEDEDTGNNLRWFNFDTASNVSWRAFSTGQTGLSGGGYSEFQTALQAWNNEAATPVDYRYNSSTTSSTNGLDTYDTINSIVFNDPTNALPTFSCVSGGVLAFGGPWYDGGASRNFKGVPYHEIVNADIVINSGISCFFSASPNASKAAQELFGHELGHTLGIDHSCGDTGSPSCNNNSTFDQALMRALVHDDARGASLNSDDRAAVQFLYSQGGAAPAAPTNLTATGTSTSTVLLGWTDNATNETEFRFEVSTLGGIFIDVGSVPANSTGANVPGLAAATGYKFRVRARNASGNSAYSNEATAATLAAPGACVPDSQTVCLLSRFRVRVVWRASGGVSTPANVAPAGSASSGIFFFSNPNNWELLIKYVNGCPINNRQWIFYAATTNVELTITVTDMQNGQTKVYFNPLGTPAPPVQDTGAFATCP